MPKQYKGNRAWQKYHDHAWLVAQLKKHGTVRATAEANNINLRTLQDYMHRHGIASPANPEDFGRPLADPKNPSRTTLWRRSRQGIT